MHHGEPSRRSGRAQHEAAAFNLNLSFEELSGAGLEEPPRHSNNSHWPVRLRVCSSVCHNSRYDYPLIRSVHTHFSHTCTRAKVIIHVKIAGVSTDVHNARNCKVTHPKLPHGCIASVPNTHLASVLVTSVVSHLCGFKREKRTAEEANTALKDGRIKNTHTYTQHTEMCQGALCSIIFTFPIPNLQTLSQIQANTHT